MLQSLRKRIQTVITNQTYPRINFTKRCLVTIQPIPVPSTFEHIHFREAEPTSDEIKLVERGLRIYPNFITVEEHDALVSESDTVLAKRKYVEDHWDNVISNYKETEKNNWSPVSSHAIQKVKSMFLGQIYWKYGVHVLDLAPEGPIGAHIDAVASSGDILAGLSLLSETVMTLKRDKTVIDMLLPPRTLYIMTDEIRYEFTHEIPGEVYVWKGQSLKRQRRISIMFRDEAKDVIEMFEGMKETN